MSWLSKNAKVIIPAATTAAGAYFGGPMGAMMGGSLGLGVSSAMGQAEATEEANKLNVGIAREQMAFQERMSGSAHQREVQDLIKAGLNPLLSVNSGASTPSGALATMDPVPSASTAFASSAKDALKTGLELKMLNKNIDVADTVAKNNRDMNRGINAQADKSEFDRDMAYNERWRNDNQLLLEKKYPRLTAFMDMLERRWGTINSAKGVGESLMRPTPQKGDFIINNNPRGGY